MQWFTTQAPNAASLEPLWTRLARSLVPVRAVKVPADLEQAMDILDNIENKVVLDSHSGNSESGQEGGGVQMSLAEYVRELSGFDVVMCANSLDNVQTKVAR